MFRLYIHKTESFLYMYTYTYITMVKLVSLSDKAYGLLKSIKSKDDSFSDVVVSLVETKKGNVRDILKLAGSWNITEKEAAKITKTIYEVRSKSHARELTL